VSDNFNDMLGGKVTPSASFAGQFPISWDGVIEDVTRNPAYEYDQTKPSNRGAQKFWPDGNPVMNVWVTLKTEVRVDQDDDGRRVLVLDSKNKLEAVQQAVRESRANFAKGGRLFIEYYGRDPNGKNADNPPKLYRARYAGPDLLAGAGAPPTQAVSAPQATPAAPAWGGQASAPAAPGRTLAPAWGNPPTQAVSAPQGGGWGAAAPSAQQPAGGGGWGAPPAPAPEPDPTTYDEFVAAFKRKGVDPSTITSPEQAAQVWAIVKSNPNVA